MFYNWDRVIPKYGETSPEEIRLRSKYACMCESLYREYDIKNDRALDRVAQRLLLLNLLPKIDIPLIRDFSFFVQVHSIMQLFSF